VHEFELVHDNGNRPKLMVLVHFHDEAGFHKYPQLLLTASIEILRHDSQDVDILEGFESADVQNVLSWYHGVKHPNL
jgi:hypothetical protein